MSWIEKRNTKQGIRFYIYWREGNRKRSKRAGGSKVLAYKLKNMLEANQIQKENGLGDNLISLENVKKEYIEYGQKLNRNERTIEGYEYSLDKLITYFGNVRMSKIKRYEMEQFKKHILKSHAVNGMNKIFNTVQAFFNYGVKMSYIQENPARGMMEKPQEVARFLTNDEVKRLLEACRTNNELYGIVQIALHTGMREGQILKIRPHSISAGQIMVEAQKGGKPHLVPIHSKIKDYVESIDFSKWDKNRLTRAYRRAIVRANLGKVRFHDLRHTFCSNYLKSGGTILDLMKITGHTQIKTLQIYSHFQPNYLNEKIENISYV